MSKSAVVTFLAPTTGCCLTKFDFSRSVSLSHFIFSNSYCWMDLRSMEDSFELDRCTELFLLMVTRLGHRLNCFLGDVYGLFECDREEVNSSVL